MGHTTSGISRRDGLRLALFGAPVTVFLAACSDGSSSSSDSPPATATAPSTTPAPTATAKQGGGSVPTSLKIPSINFDRKLTAMGLSSEGTISPGPGVTQWYNATVSPGQPGISVIAGHVTWNGPDVFANLEKVKVGDKFTIGYANGASQEFVVTRDKKVDKEELQRDQTVWGSSKTPVVCLITCDQTSQLVGQHHVNNFVVWAKPV